MNPLFSSSVAGLATTCTSKFDELLSMKNSAPKIHIQNRAADFQLWVDGVGAVAKPGASLDSRFRDRPNDLILIKGILVMLIDFLSELSTEGNSSDTELINVDSALSNLAMIGVAIRRTGKASRSRRADQSFNPDQYEDLRRHLECIILLRPTESIPKFKVLDANKAIASDKAEAVASSLHDMVSSQLGQLNGSNLTEVQLRLIDTNLRRRHRFVLAQKRSQHNKAAQQAAHQTARQDAHQAAYHGKIPFTGAKLQSGDITTSPQTLKTEPKTQESPQQQPQAPPTTAFMSSASTAEGTMTYDPKAAYVPTIAQSQISVIANETEFPRISLQSSDRQIIECPCCCQPLPYEEARKPTNWRQHLIEDVCPYSCVAEKCPAPHLLFATRKAWDIHVENDHPCQWKCIICGRDKATFSEISDLTNHIKSCHQDDLSNQSLSDLIEWSRIQRMGITSCPLCSSHGPEDSPELVDHVVRHAYEFALRSLPWPRPPVEDLNKPVGTYAPPKDPMQASSLMTWLEDAFCSGTQRNIELSSFDKADHDTRIDDSTSQGSLEEHFFYSHNYFDQISTAGSQLVTGAETQASDDSRWATSEPRPSIQVGSLDSLRTKLKEPEGQWIKTQFTSVDQFLFHSVPSDKPRQIRIALLGTGFGIPHSEKEILRDKVVWRDFVEPDNLYHWKDDDATPLRFGHGTFMVSLLLKLVPRAKIYVCRIAQSRETMGTTDAKSAIAQAIKWASEPSQDVDIIILSFGSKDDSPIIQQAITKAMNLKQRKLLIFAAASDPGALFEYFPARLPDVISARGTDLYGNLILDYNPLPSRSRKWPMFCALAQNVPCEMGNNEENRMSGCPVAALILAATAALFLQYAECTIAWSQREGWHDPPEVAKWKIDALREKSVMERLLQEVGEEAREGIWFIKPRLLFQDFKEDSRRWPPVLKRVLSQIPDRE